MQNKTPAAQIASVLLPCPFCGSENIAKMDSDWEGHVDCDSCGAMMRCRSNLLGRPIEQAIKRWNTRHQQEVIKQLVGALVASDSLLVSSRNKMKPVLKEKSFQWFNVVRKKNKQALAIAKPLLGEK